MIKKIYPGLNYLPEIDFLIRFKIACRCVLWRTKKIFFSDICDYYYVRKVKNCDSKAKNRYLSSHRC